MRQAGQDPEVVGFRALLMQMRNGQVRKDDWKLLLQRSTKNVLMDEFNGTIRLHFDKKSVAEYNYQKLENGQPVAKIKAKIPVTWQVLLHLMKQVDWSSALHLYQSRSNADLQPLG